MATNYKQPGKVITFTAPYQRNAGEAAMLGSLLGIAQATVANAVAGEFATTGVWTIAKTAAQAWTAGDKIYWNAGTKLVSNVSTDGPLVGIATADAANPSNTGDVRLNGASMPFGEGQEAAIVSLTDNGGGAAADDTIAVITNAANAGSADVAPVADAIKELSTKVNAILVALRAAGIIAT